MINMLRCTKEEASLTREASRMSVCHKSSTKSRFIFFLPLSFQLHKMPPRIKISGLFHYKQKLKATGKHEKKAEKRNKQIQMEIQAVTCSGML